MVTMGSVWDRTAQVVAGRGAMLAGIALPTILLPTIVRDAFVAYSTQGTASFALVGGMLSIIVLVLAIWGQLAIIAVASDPGTDRGGAFRIATGRLLPAVGVTLVMLVAITITILPAVAMLASAGIDFKAMGAGQAPTAGSVSGALAAGALLYAFVWSLALFWVGAKLTVWQPVLVNERNGLRALSRSWALTNGSTWRIIGVLILFGIVFLVAVLAAQSVTGIVLRLILGPEHIATAVFLAGIVASAVSTALATLAIVFMTRLYDALAEAKPAA